MAWIEAHQELARHPKLKKAARALDVPQPQLIGHLFLLWWWALDYAPDGGPIDAADINDAAEWDGPPGLAGTLEAFGFLDHDDEGYWIHDWYDYAGKWVQSKAERTADGRRGAHYRWHVQEERYDPNCRFCNPPYSPPNSPPIAPPNSPPIGRGSAYSTAQHLTVPTEQQQSTRAEEPSYPQLLAIAETIVDERIAAGYDVTNRGALVRTIAKSEEALHRWHKNQPASDMAWTGIGDTP